MTGAWADVRLDDPDPEQTPSKKKSKGKRKHSCEPDSEEDGGAYHPRKGASRRKRKRRNWGRPTSDDSGSDEEDESDENEDEITPATKVLVSRKGKGKPTVDLSSVMAELHELRKVAAAAEKAAEPARLERAPPQYELVIEEQRVYEGESISHVFWSTTEVSPDASPPMRPTPSMASLSSASTPSGQLRISEEQMGAAGNRLHGEKEPSLESTETFLGIPPAVLKVEEGVSVGMLTLETEPQKPETDPVNMVVESEEQPGRSPEITLNVFSRSGKVVARELRVSSRYTFADLVKVG